MVSQLTALESFMSFLGSIMAVMIPVILKIRAQMKRNEEAMKSVPPSANDAPGNVFEHENEILRADILRLRWRLDELIQQFTDISREHSHALRALNRERDECERLRIRVSELERPSIPARQISGEHGAADPVRSSQTVRAVVLPGPEVQEDRDDRPTTRVTKWRA